MELFRYEDSTIRRRACDVCSSRVNKFYVYPVVNEHYSDSAVNGYTRYDLEKRVVCKSCTSVVDDGFEKILTLKKRTNHE